MRGTGGVGTRGAVGAVAGAVMLAMMAAGCASSGASGRSAPGTPAPDLAEIYYTPLGVCGTYETYGLYSSVEEPTRDRGVGEIFVVARIDSIRTPNTFAFDPRRFYIGSPGQTDNDDTFDRQFTTVHPMTVQPGGLPFVVGDFAVGYRTADRRTVFDNHTFALRYDAWGVAVRQSHADSRPPDHGRCSETMVFTG
jgi:hypothetical protein